MKNIKSQFFTIGQFASLHKINKKTLMWYDQIDLFKPALVKENGYRYYTYQQSSTLETILMLRELKVSLPEIKTYINNKSENSLKKLLTDKIDEIDQTIEHMKTIQEALIQQKKDLDTFIETDLHAITIVEKEEQPLLLLQIPKKTSLDKEIEILVCETKKHQNNHLYLPHYGSVLSVKHIYQQHFDHYDALSLALPYKTNQHYNHICPKGKYVRAYCQGSWDKLPKKYLEILDFAKEKHLQLYGYAYETGINDYLIDSYQNYVTMIEIPILEL